MRRLKYTRYVAQGGDWGAFVTTAMAQQQPAGLAAIHLNFAQTMPDQLPRDLLPDQKRVVEAMKAWRENGSAYLQLQMTRPQLAGYLLADSPVAQAAWIYDIFNAGTGNTGDPEGVLSRDAMLDEITLYWLTNSAASSARFYLEQGTRGERTRRGRDQRVHRNPVTLVTPTLRMPTLTLSHDQQPARRIEKGTNDERHPE